MGNARQVKTLVSIGLPLASYRSADGCRAADAAQLAPALGLVCAARRRRLRTSGVTPASVQREETGSFDVASVTCVSSVCWSSPRATPSLMHILLEKIAFHALERHTSDP